ncbi:MAG: hypothetical protein DI537_31110 [Stutzerimonas stutzeri]|nr:MAG: hypothetical protein DI537_31110 [Stutzerimonas stutzeri]
MSETKFEELRMSGASPRDLANQVSDAINAALKRGMETDEACCVAVSVIADYARMEYGDSHLAALAHVVTQRAKEPRPQDIGGRYD